MFSYGLVEQEITRRYYRNHAEWATPNIGYQGPPFSLNFPYQFILGRSPSIAETEPFRNALNHNLSRKKILKTILYSRESILRNEVPPTGIYFSSMNLLTKSSSQFVPSLYLSILNRPPLDNELIFWQKRQRRVTRFVVLLLFLRVFEYRYNFKIAAFSGPTFILQYTLIRAFSLTKHRLKKLILPFYRQLNKTKPGS